MLMEIDMSVISIRGIPIAVVNMIQIDIVRATLENVRFRDIHNNVLLYASCREDSRN
jgi:hypothetical protein